ncbi:MAG TPA: RNA 2',3'-cyclic phosphodiesterase [Alphaproteobacteria bacterium]|jgi:2'-5' RNA ligase
MIRLFVGIELPEPLREQLSLLQGGVPNAAWTAPENMHLTLRFIGEVPEGSMGEIDDVLADVSVPPFELSLAGVDTFARGREPTTIWAGLDPSEPLHLLHGRIDKGLARAGFPNDERRYTPHVTLGRLHRAPEMRVAEFVAAHNLFRAPPFGVEQFSLFSSHQASSGTVYTVEADYPLI